MIDQQPGDLGLLACDDHELFYDRPALVLLIFKLDFYKNYNFREASSYHCLHIMYESTKGETESYSSETSSIISFGELVGLRA